MVGLVESPGRDALVNWRDEIGLFVNETLDSLDTANSTVRESMWTSIRAVLEDYAAPAEEELDSVVATVSDSLNETLVESGVLDDLVADAIDVVLEGLEGRYGIEGVWRQLVELVDTALVSPGLLETIFSDSSASFMDFFQENSTLGSIVDEVLDIVNETFPDIEPRIDALRLATDVVSSEVLDLDFGLVREELVSLTDGFLDLTDANTSTAVVEWLLDSIESNNTLAARVAVGVSFGLEAVVVGLVERRGADATFELDDVRSMLNFVLGGNETADVEGFLDVQASSVVLNLESGLLRAEGVEISTASRSWSYDSAEVASNLTADDILSRLPTGTAKLQLSIDTDATILHNASSPHAV